MRLGGALIGTAVALALASPRLARADDARQPQTKEPAAQAPKAPQAPQAEAPLPPLSEARPPLPPAPEQASVPWHNHLEIGGGLAVVELPAHLDGSGAKTPMRFKPAPGFHLDLSWNVFKYLRFTGYILEHDHAVEFPAGSFVSSAGTSFGVTGPTMHMYTFGVRFSPVLPLGKRARLWATGGLGWGRIEYPRYTLMDQTNQSSGILRERAENLFEVPVGLGGSFEIIPRWLSVHIELTGSFVPSQTGDALDGSSSQVIVGGKIEHVGTMPKLDAAFTQTIGLSLHL